MKVIATSMGFFGKARRRKGDVFDVPDGTKAKWFEPCAVVAKEPEATTAAPAPKVIKATKAAKGFGDLV